MNSRETVEFEFTCSLQAFDVLFFQSFQNKHSNVKSTHQDN
jgi:hypothetical protein